MLVNIGLSDLYTGEILESDGKRYYVLLLMPKVRGKVNHMSENGEYRGTVRLFDVDIDVTQNKAQSLVNYSFRATRNGKTMLIGKR